MTDVMELRAGLGQLARQAEYLATAIGMTARGLPAEDLRRVVAAADLIRGGQQDLLRVLGLLKPAAPPARTVSVDDFGQVMIDGEYAALAPTLADVIRVFAGRIGEVVTFDEILQPVWGTTEAAGGLRHLRPAIRRLRLQLAGRLTIESVFGRGYRLDLAEDGFPGALVA